MLDAGDQVNLKIYVSRSGISINKRNTGPEDWE
jgi:hypothetical protein